MLQRLEISIFFKNYSKVELGYVTTFSIQVDSFIVTSKYVKETAEVLTYCFCGWISNGTLSLEYLLWSVESSPTFLRSTEWVRYCRQFQNFFQVEPDAEGVTPLRLAALYGKDNIIQYFGSGKFIDHAKPEIAFNIEKEDIVESIELMGCWYVDRKKGKGSINI